MPCRALDNQMLCALQAVFQSSEVGYSIPYILNSRGNCHSSLAALVRSAIYIASCSVLDSGGACMHAWCGAAGMMTMRGRIEAP